MQAAARFKDRRKHHLHRKTSFLPSELKNAYAFLISQSERQCFSHEDECFAAGNQSICAACMNCCQISFHPHAVLQLLRTWCSAVTLPSSRIARKTWRGIRVSALFFLVFVTVPKSCSSDSLPAAKYPSSWEKHCRSDREIAHGRLVARASSQGRSCVFRWRWCLTPDLETHVQPVGTVS